MNGTNLIVVVSLFKPHINVLIHRSRHNAQLRDSGFDAKVERIGLSGIWEYRTIIGNRYHGRKSPYIPIPDKAYELGHQGISPWFFPVAKLGNNIVDNSPL